MQLAYQRRAAAHQSAGDYDRAINDYRSLLRFDLEDREARHNLGFMFTEQGRYREAIEEYNQALLTRTDDHTYYFLFEAWLLLMEWEEAKATVERAEEVPQSNITWKEIASLMKEYRGDAQHFQDRYGITLPKDIENLLSD